MNYGTVQGQTTEDTHVAGMHCRSALFHKSLRKHEVHQITFHPIDKVRGVRGKVVLQSE